MGTDRQRRRVIMLYPCEYTYIESENPLEEGDEYGEK